MSNEKSQELDRMQDELNEMMREIMSGKIRGKEKTKKLRKVDRMQRIISKRRSGEMFSRAFKKDLVS